MIKKLKILICFLILLSNILLGQTKIIIDTDMGSDCDDAGAMALLHHYADQGKAEILACIYSSGKVPFGVGVIDAINHYYDRPDIPIGANWNDEVGDPKDKMSAEKLAKDSAAFGHDLISSTDAIEQTRLNRDILAKQADSSVVYITIGHTKGLYDLLVSSPDNISPLSGKELIKSKIRCWVALGALGAHNENNEFRKDWNFFFNNTAGYTDYLVKHFPEAIYFINAGSNVMTGKSLIPTDPGNIVRTVYRDWLWNVFQQTLDDQRPSWDLAAVCFAIEGCGKFLQSAPRGYLEFDPEKGCRWVVGKNDRNHRMVIQKDGLDQAFAEYLNRRIVK